MQEETNGATGLATLEAAQPISSWWAAAVGEYERSWPVRQAGLQTELAARILAMTGRQVSPGEIYATGHLAVVGVDGVTFRLEHRDDGGRLCLLRDGALREPENKHRLGSRVRPVGLEAAT